jgi:hypothetical protein
VRLYLGAASRPSLRKARERAPSHIHGVTWTPADQRLNGVPFIVDNGAFTGTFDPDEWVELLDKLDDFAYRPDFVVLPDGYNDAEKTLERHRQWVGEVHDRHLPAAAVLQPGLPIPMQVELADRIGASFVFVGGSTRWKRAHGEEIVAEAHDRGLIVHIGNPDSKDGLLWSYRIGADSVDTSTIVQNESWEWLTALENITERHSKGAPFKNGKQQTVGDFA